VSQLSWTGRRGIGVGVRVRARRAGPLHVSRDSTRVITKGCQTHKCARVLRRLSMNRRLIWMRRIDLTHGHSEYVVAKRVLLRSIRKLVLVNESTVQSPGLG